MKVIPELHSPRQIASAFGVSESSLKRWCDQGLIPTTRTAGRHRKVRTEDAIAFARTHGMTLVTPELLGFPPAGTVKELDLRASAHLLAEALLAGDEFFCRQIVLNLVFGEHALARVFDEVIGQAFARIGDLWACQKADLYQERRGCEMILRIFSEIRKAQPTVPRKLTACGGTASGNTYSLQTLMAEIVLRDCGYLATSLGTDIPFDSLIRAVREIRPTLFWLSAAYVADEAEFLHGFARLSAVCAEMQSALVIGGRGLTAILRERMVDAAYCDNMQQLAGLARNLARVHQRSLSAATRVSKRKS